MCSAASTYADIQEFKTHEAKSLVNKSHRITQFYIQLFSCASSNSYSSGTGPAHIKLSAQYGENNIDLPLYVAADTYRLDVVAKSIALSQD